MENNNINNTDVNITEEVQEKKEDLKIIKLKPSQLEILKEYKTHKKDSYYDLFERLVNNKDDIKLHNALVNENKHTCTIRFDRRIKNNILSHDETVNIFKKCLDQMEKDGYTLERAKLIFSRDILSDTSFMNK